MAKLTDTQFIVLSKAAARDDGIASIPGGLNKAAATKVGASLVSRKLMRKVRSKPDVPVWREDEEGRGTSLVITREGREAIGLEDGENDSSNLSLGAEERDVRRRQRPFQKRLNRIDEPRPGSKQAIIVTMLSRKSGATLEALVDATGWLPHTTRAALTGLRKRGYTVLLERQDGRPSLYRIAFSHDRKAASVRQERKVPQPPSTAAETRPVESEIQVLEQAGVIAVRAEWRRLFGSDPPRLSRDLLVRSLGYRVQERALGGLSVASLKRLRELADNPEGRGPPPEQ